MENSFFLSFVTVSPVHGFVGLLWLFTNTALTSAILNTAFLLHALSTGALLCYNSKLASVSSYRTYETRPIACDAVTIKTKKVL